MIIGTETFKGVRPKIAAQLINPSEAQDAKDCNLKYGDLRPFLGPDPMTALTNDLTYLTIHRYLGTHWFAWEADVDVVQASIAEDTANRRYYTGDGIPKKTNEDEATTGSGDKPINFYPMGVPVPHSALTATPSGSGGTGTARDAVYCWTIRTAWGEESRQSPPSSVISALSGETVNLSGMTIKWQAGATYDLTHWVVPTTLADHVYKCVQAGISGAAEPTWGTTVDGDTTDGTVKWRCYKKGILFTGYAEKRIYRSITGNESAGYYRIASIAMTEESYADSVSDAQAVLNAMIPSWGFDPPPDDLIGLFSMGAYYVGWRSASKELCFSEPYYPHAWPISYRRNVDSTIIAAGGVGTTIIVATEGSPAVFSGSTPATMTQKKLAESRPCLSKRGFVMFPQGAVWPVAQGLYFTDGTDGKVFTEQTINRKEWEAYHPDTLQAMEFGGAYLTFYKYGTSEGALLIDLVDGIFMPLSLYTTAAFVDQQEQKLYYVEKTVAAELMPNQTDRDFSAASAWANVDLSAYDETGDLTITASAIGQYCTLPIASAPTTSGQDYVLKVDVANLVSTWTIKSYDGTQTYGQITAAGTDQEIEFTASTDGGIRIVADAADSSGDFDNFSLKLHDTNEIMEWEGDETQNFAGFAWESKDFIEPKRFRLCCGRVEFTPGDLADYWALVVAYQETLHANTEKIAAYDLGSIVPQGGFDLGVYGPADDDLEPLDEPPEYAGDLSLQLKVYSDDVLRKTIDLYHTGIFKFDGGDARHKWKYRIEGNVDRVKSVYLASTATEIKNAKSGG